MGVWGDQPWDNDGAADFFGSVFPADFHDKVMAALRLDDFDAGDWQEVWAAAWLVHALAHSGYVWPGDMRAACVLAAERLDQLAAYDEPPADPEVLRRQAAELRARRHRPLGL
jgi:hypothetical protein